MSVERTFALKIPYLAIFRLELEKIIAMLDFSTFNLSKCNISCKKTLLNVGPRLSYLGWNSKKLLYCGILHQHPKIFRKRKISSSNKNL